MIVVMNEDYYRCVELFTTNSIKAENMELLIELIRLKNFSSAFRNSKNFNLTCQVFEKPN